MDSNISELRAVRSKMIVSRKLLLWMGIIIVIVLRNTTHYPKWFVLFMPVVGSLIITVISQSHIIPVIGNLFYPMVLSLPHLCFFTIYTLFVNKSFIYKEGSI